MIFIVTGLIYSVQQAQEPRAAKRFNGDARSRNHRLAHHDVGI